LDNLTRHIESLIFTTSDTISFEEIKAALEGVFDQDIQKKAIEKALDSLLDRYKEEHYAIEIVNISGGYRFMTKAAYHNTVGQHLKILSKKKLSKAAIETLAIIAYKQTIPKSEIEAVRGVNCDYSVQKLLEHELIEITGRSDGPGRPLLYGTSDKFMDHFGLSDLKDLPQLKELEQENSIGGEQAPGENNNAEETVSSDNIDRINKELNSVKETTNVTSPTEEYTGSENETISLDDTEIIEGPDTTENETKLVEEMSMLETEESTEEMITDIEEYEVKKELSEEDYEEIEVEYEEIDIKKDTERAPLIEDIEQKINYNQEEE